MGKLKFVLILSILLAALSACGSEPPAEPPTYSIQGAWDYTLYYEEDGSQNTYDAGTFTFSGNDIRGTYLMLNFYQVEYEGSYTVDGEKIMMAGPEILEGIFEDAIHLSGTWVSEESGISGTWEAVRQ